MIEIIRSGNLLAVKGAQSVLPALAPLLTYNHRTYYQGYELVKRKQLKRLNPGAVKVAEFDDTPMQLFTVKEGVIYCSAGLKFKISKFLDVSGLPYKFEDLRKKKLPDPDIGRLADMKNLEFRHKQEDVISIIASCDGGIIQAPTGYGKTFIATVLCKIYPTSNIVFISPGVDLIKSTYQRLNEVIPGCVGRIGAGYYEPDNRIILASADSLHKVNLGKANLIVVDEVHAFATDKRSKGLCSQYTEAKFIGFTASYNCRADGADAVLESIFGPLLVEISYEEAVENGVVSDIRTIFLNVANDGSIPELTGDQVSKKRNGYWRNRLRNQKIATACNNLHLYTDAHDPQVLIMCETVEHIFELKSLLPDYTVVYANLSDDTKSKLELRGLVESDTEALSAKERQAILKDFESGKIKKVISNYCWKQGIDPRHLNVLIRADGGVGEIGGIQIGGRLSRKNEHKSSGVLIDMWDEFDPWALARSKKRKQVYLDNGYNVQT